MKKVALALAVVIGLGLTGMGTSAAQAATPIGIHFGSGGVHVDVGRVYHRSHSVVAPRYYGAHSYGSHYDWHPATYTRRGGVLIYTPGHWDRHRTSHYGYYHSGYGY